MNLSDLTSKEEQKLKELTAAFLEENAKLNLSAFRTEEACWIGNVLDSLAVLELYIFRSPPPSGEGLGVGEEREIAQKKPIGKSVLYHAREMRKKPTEAEAMLWKQLNNDQLGVRFRRQHPIDGKILDFYCHDARLGIELDGATHTQQEQKEWDDERTQSLLASHGIRVMRFWNGDVLHNLDSVLEKIRKAIHHSPPSPALPPQGEGGTEGLGLPAGRQGWEEIKFLDIGTGGGFPLLPLALCLPDCSFTGIDSTQKKIDAVYRIVERLGLENCRLFCGRTEELGREAEHREQYDVVTARAVAPVNILLEYAAPFTKVGGHVVLWKSLNIEKELEESLLARAELSCHLVKQHEYSLEDCLPAEASSEDGLPAEAEGHVVSDDVGPPSPRLRRATFCEGWGERQLLVFEKTFATKEIYPRDTGIPKKNPLR